MWRGRGAQEGLQCRPALPNSKLAHRRGSLLRRGASHPAPPTPLVPPAVPVPAPRRDRHRGQARGCRVREGSRCWSGLWLEGATGRECQCGTKQRPRRAGTCASTSRVAVFQVVTVSATSPCVSNNSHNVEHWLAACGSYGSRAVRPAVCERSRCPSASTAAPWRRWMAAAQQGYAVALLLARRAHCIGFDSRTKLFMYRTASATA